MNQISLRAPSTDGALLAIPPLREASDVLEQNRSALEVWDYDVQGRPATAIRAKARAEILELSRSFLERYGLDVPSLPSSEDPDGPAPAWVVTGHQPELFHPGVWVKNFAAAAISRKVGGISLNLIVDNDLPKSASISVPVVESDAIRRVGVPFDNWPEREVPFEDLAVADEQTFAAFPARVRELLAGAVDDPLIDEFWPLAEARRGEVDNVGLRFAVARREIEQRWGAANLEVPLSQVCQTDAFLWFLSHILAQLPRFQEIHNLALREYRNLYGIRSRNHPVADLASFDDWRESPFWAWRAERPRRQPLLARQAGRNIQLRIAGEQEVLVELPLGPDREACCAVEVLRELPARGIRIRTRALTTTMFSRFLLGDLFLHGIGGAKYDELGDSIAGRFFGFPPPAFMTLSQTLWLGLPSDPDLAMALESVRHRLRDAEFNPDRILSEPIPAEARTIIEAKRKAISSPRETRLQRKIRRREIRELNEALQGFAADQKESLEARLHVIQKGLQSNRIATSREYSLVLHSRSRLESSMRALGSGIVSG